MAEIMHVYRRRPKSLLPATVDDDKENDKELQLPLTALERNTSRNSEARKSQHSWIDRSLSSRNNITKVKPETFPLRQANAKAKQIISPNVYRKKRVEAPANFIRDQRNYFEQVDAFELEEESPRSKEHWRPSIKEDTVGASYVAFHKNWYLHAVQEDALENSPNYAFVRNASSHKDCISSILKTPQSLQIKPSKGKLLVSKQVSGGSHWVSHETHKTPLASVPGVGAQQMISRGSQGDQGRKAVSRDHSTQETIPCIVISSGEGGHLGQSKNKSASKGFATPKEPIPFINISSDEDEHCRMPLKPKTVSSSKYLTGARNAVINECSDAFVEPARCWSQRISSDSKENADDENGIDLSVGALKKTSNVQLAKTYREADEVFDGKIDRLKFWATKGPPELDTLLQKCSQKTPMQLEETIGQLSDLKNLEKLGEGTYGEAFRSRNIVFKIVPVGGSFYVNDEVQKSFAEMYTEVLLNIRLNRLRNQRSLKLGAQRNVCSNFIETKMVRVCQGLYGQTLVNAWEEWHTRHGSENDHPKIFPENQVYMLFVLEDGGKDLESFPVASFNVTRSILTQVTTGLAIAEVDCEFEHRDLHWGNILVAETKLAKLHCRLDGTDMQIVTHGVLVSIIDFTLSRLCTGNEVLFSNLSHDPALFKGPKGDIQAETYRKMLHLTKGRWDKRFSKTNCYWIIYLVDIFLTKRKCVYTHQEIRALRGLKKRMVYCNSARECLGDEFFTESETLTK